MALIDGQRIVMELGSWFAEQAGVDPNDVKGIDLHFHMDELATADVKLVVRYGDGAEARIAEELRRYQLVRVEDSEEEPESGGAT